MSDHRTMPTEPSARTLSSQRSVARKLALQALYRWQLNECPWQDLIQEFREAEDTTRADPDYFRELVEGVWRTHADLDSQLAGLMDRKPERLDPIEHAALLIGLFELGSRPEVPYRVAINEAVELAKMYGGENSGRFVNGVLGTIAGEISPIRSDSTSDHMVNQ